MGEAVAPPAGPGTSRRNRNPSEILPLLDPGVEQRLGPQPASLGDGDGGAGAVLVGLAAPDGDAQALGHALDVGEPERHQLGAPEGPGHAEGQQRPVAHRAQVVAGDGAQHVAEHVGIGGVLPDRGDAVAAADAGHDLEDGGRTFAGLGRLEPGAAMHPADRGQAAADGERRRAGLRLGGEEHGDDTRVGGQALELPREAPGGEAPPVAGVGALGAGGARGVGVAPRGGDLGVVEAGQVGDGRIRRVRRRRVGRDDRDEAAGVGRCLRGCSHRRSTTFISVRKSTYPG